MAEKRREPNTEKQGRTAVCKGDRGLAAVRQEEMEERGLFWRPESDHFSKKG